MKGKLTILILFAGLLISFFTLEKSNQLRSLFSSDISLNNTRLNLSSEGTPTESFPDFFAEIPDGISDSELFDYDQDYFPGGFGNSFNTDTNLPVYKHILYCTLINAGLNNAKFIINISDLPPPAL